MRVEGCRANDGNRAMMTRRSLVVSLVLSAALAPLAVMGNARAADVRVPHARGAVPALLYVSMVTGNAVLVFDASKHDPQPLATITQGLSLPTALAVDGAGNLYVCNAGTRTITEYAPGKTMPAFTYDDGPITVPRGIAIGANGNIFVANTIGVNGQISVFRPGVAKPIGSLSRATSLWPAPLALTFDGTGNLFVLYARYAQGPAAVVEYVGGTSSVRTLPLEVPENASSIAVDDTGNVLLSNGRQISVFHVDQPKPVRFFERVGFPLAIAFDHERQSLYIADQFNNFVSTFAYPKTRLVNFFTHGMKAPSAIALSPPPQ
jgi:serine/threonine-protein kinase